MCAAFRRNFGARKLEICNRVWDGKTRQGSNGLADPVTGNHL
jgi:hypothetical protein